MTTQGKIWKFAFRAEGIHELVRTLFCDIYLVFFNSLHWNFKIIDHNWWLTPWHHCTMGVSNNMCKNIYPRENEIFLILLIFFFSLTFLNIHSLQLRESPKVVVYCMRIVLMHSTLASQVFTYIKVKCFLLSPKSVSEHVIY